MDDTKEAPASNPFSVALHDMLMQMNLPRNHVIDEYMLKASGEANPEITEQISELHDYTIHLAFERTMPNETGDPESNPQSAKQFNARLRHYMKESRKEALRIGGQPAADALDHLVNNLMRSAKKLQKDLPRER